MDCYVNGVQRGPSTSAITDISDTANDLWIGAQKTGTTNPLDGHIGEIVACSSSLTAQSRLECREYLSAKWDISV
jgi:hypothetical protein